MPRGSLPSVHEMEPAVVAVGAQDDDDGWRPARTDRGQRATAWRAFNAYEGLVSLRVSVDTLNATIARFTSTIKWIAGIMSPFVAVLVVDSAHSAFRTVADFLSSFHR